jgi:hypothetical protein
MRLQYLKASAFVLILTFPLSEAFAQRGGRGRPGGPVGGGMPRGGGFSGGGGMPRGGPQGGYGGGVPRGGGGFGGGAPHEGGYGGGGGARGARPGAGNYGGGGARPGAGNYAGAGARPGVGNYGAAGARPGVGNYAGAGAGSRPGVGNYAGAAGARPGVGNYAGARPGVGSYSGTPGSNVGSRPGVASNYPGAGTGQLGSNVGQASSNVGQAASNLAGYHPYADEGLGAGAYGGLPYGTGYAGWGAYGAQGAAFASAANACPYYGASWYGGYAGSWAPTNMAYNSLYTSPGYAATAQQVGLAAQPADYAYGSNVVIQPGGVYVNGDAAGTPQQYADQAGQIAGAGASAQPDPNAKWVPLGVFAVVAGDATTSDDIFQLAVNPQGLIRGNYHNLKSNQVEQISGSVDKQSQRAAWRIGKDQTPVYEAGIGNLTKDATPILVHADAGQTTQVSLIRLHPPDQPSGGAAPTGGQ